MVGVLAADTLPGLRVWVEPTRKRRQARVTRVLVLVVILVLIVASPAQAAAPNYIVVSGSGLARPVLLANWNENLVLLLAVANAPTSGITTRALANRPRYDLAEFWGWSGRPRPTSARGANQHGQFYPAHGVQPAVVVMTARGVTVPRLAPTSLLKILGRHGVPTRR